ncbi:MAG: VOC family protein [Bellilinea sp.]
MTSSALFSRIDTVIVRVRNLKQSKAWFQEVLGLPAVHEDLQENLVVFGLESGSSLTVWQLKDNEQVEEGGRPQRSYPIFYSDDIQTVYQQLVNHRVKTTQIQGEAGDVRWFQFFDPDGNTFEVCQY